MRFLKLFKGIGDVKAAKLLDQLASCIDIQDCIKTIKYDVKVLRGFIRTFDMFHPHEVHLVNRVLWRAGLLKKNQHFKLIKVN